MVARGAYEYLTSVLTGASGGLACTTHRITASSLASGDAGGRYTPERANPSSAHCLHTDSPARSRSLPTDRVYAEHGDIVGILVGGNRRPKEMRMSCNINLGSVNSIGVLCGYAMPFIAVCSQIDDADPILSALPG
jgi:hypothetical protein